MIVVALAACRHDTAPVTTIDTAGLAGTTETGTTVPEVIDLGPALAPSTAPGLGAAVFDRRGLLAFGVTGVRAATGADPIAPDDLWHLGSDTKAMTATLAAQLVDDGTWSFEMPVADLFPGVKVDPGWDGVTLGMLLQHRSGMGDPPEHDDLWTAMWTTPDEVAARASFASAIFAAPPDYAPGEFRYSNFGYIAVGAALEAETGESWEDRMTERVFSPLGMGSCGFGPPGTPGETDQPWGHQGEAPDYVPVDPGDPYADNPPTLGPAGTVHCSLADWSKFGVDHLLGAGGEGALASPSSYEWLHTPPPGETYAGGWGFGHLDAFGGAYLSHDGSNTMWYASAVIALDAGRVYLVTANAGDQAAEDEVHDVLFALPEEVP